MTASNADGTVVLADFVVAFLASTFWLILSAVSSDNSLQSSGKEHILMNPYPRLTYTATLPTQQHIKPTSNKS